MRPFKTPTLTFWLIGFSLLAAAAGIAATVQSGMTLRRDQTAALTRDVQAQTEALAKRIESDIAVFDLALRDAARAPVTAHVVPPSHALIAQYVSFIDILDGAGDVVGSSRVLTAKPPNFQSRDYFREQLYALPNRLAIGRPFATTSWQSAAIPLSRRLETVDGKFSGVVVAGVRLTWLRDVLANTGTRAAVTIRREDGPILLRGRHDLDDVGRIGGADPVFQAWRETGAAPAPDSQGGLRLLRKIETTTLVLDVTLDQPAIAAVTGSWLSWTLAPPLLAALCIVLLSGLAHRLRAHAIRTEAGARVANDDRMRLLATMTHELRTPLTAILGQAELLRDEGALSPKQTERLARVNEAGTLMRAVVDRVGDITRPGEHVVPVDLASADLDQFIHTCRAMVEEQARARGLTLTCHIDPSVPRNASLDRAQVQQVLVNLLSNAVKFTTEGTVTLSLRVDQNVLIFEVADTGPGIGRGVRHRLFREYDRLMTGATQTEGTGLGLSISKNLIRRMGGDLSHEDNPAGGSIFRVRLPYIAPETPVAAAMPVVSGEPLSVALRILLADDIDATREVTADVLRNAGHSVTEASDGAAALYEAGSRDFDVIVTDMRMPGYDGVETTRRIRALPDRRGRVPVVLLTADLSARQSETARAAGIDFHVAKPFKRLELLGVIDAAARLAPAPDGPDGPILDPYILDQLLSGMGRDTVDQHLDTAARRIEDLLVLLRRSPREPATRDAVHDLTGISGLLGLSALSAAARRFDTAVNPSGQADALADIAIATRQELNRRRLPAATG